MTEQRPSEKAELLDALKRAGETADEQFLRWVVEQVAKMQLAPYEDDDD